MRNVEKEETNIINRHSPIRNTFLLVLAGIPTSLILDSPGSNLYSCSKSEMREWVIKSWLVSGTKQT
jgi:ABC-type uncharacterized transport system YnjBCD ATPase subunit